MANRVEGVLTIKDTRLLFRNFSGEERQYNPAGNRNFCVVIDNLNEAKDLEEAGWPIRYLEPREEGDISTAFMRVKVSYVNRPPKVIMVTSKGQTPLTEETIGMLDWAEIKNANVAVNPYNWSNTRGSGVSAYLKTLYVEIEEDEFADQYSSGYSDDDVPFI